jgi:hypothetical protein
MGDSTRTQPEEGRTYQARFQTFLEEGGEEQEKGGEEKETEEKEGEEEDSVSRSEVEVVVGVVGGGRGEEEVRVEASVEVLGVVGGEVVRGVGGEVEVGARVTEVAEAPSSLHSLPPSASSVSSSLLGSRACCKATSLRTE